jgi:protein TonB
MSAPANKEVKQRRRDGMRQAAMHMKKVNWLYAYAASIILHAAVFLAFKSEIVGDGEPSTGQVMAAYGSIAGIIGSAIEIDQSEAPKAPETSEQAELPEPVDVSEPPAASAVSGTRPVELKEAAGEMRVPTAVGMSGLPQLIAADVEAAQLAMSAPVAHPASMFEPPQTDAKEAGETQGVENAPPPAASPRRKEKRRISRELRKAEERKRPKTSEAEGKERTTSEAQLLGNSTKEGSAGSRRGGGGKSTASSGAMNTYAARVRSKILSRRPSSSVRGGKAVVSFGLSASGGLRYARISRSSGNPSLDQKALASVRSAAPFPPPPEGASARQLRFSIFFQF